MKKHLGIALVVAASLGATGFAAAADGSTLTVESVNADGIGMLEVRSMPIRYSEAEVQDAKSAKRLFFRIRAAAAEVCRISSNPVGYEVWEESSCEKEALAEAIDLAGIPALDAYYAEMPRGLLGR